MNKKDSDNEPLYIKQITLIFMSTFNAKITKLFIALYTELLNCKHTSISNIQPMGQNRDTMTQEILFKPGHLNHLALYYHYYNK